MRKVVDRLAESPSSLRLLGKLAGRNPREPAFLCKSLDPGVGFEICDFLNSIKSITWDERELPARPSPSAIHSEINPLSPIIGRLKSAIFAGVLVWGC